MGARAGERAWAWAARVSHSRHRRQGCQHRPPALSAPPAAACGPRRGQRASPAAHPSALEAPAGGDGARGKAQAGAAVPAHSAAQRQPWRLRKHATCAGEWRTPSKHASGGDARARCTAGSVRPPPTADVRIFAGLEWERPRRQDANLSRLAVSLVAPLCQQATQRWPTASPPSVPGTPR